MLNAFGVSRASLREAPPKLEINGRLVVMQCGQVAAQLSPMQTVTIASGWRRSSSRSSKPHFATFLKLAGRWNLSWLAWPRTLPERRAELEAFLDEGLADEHDDMAYIAASGIFHHLLCGMSGNPTFALFAQAVKHICTDRIRGIAFRLEGR